ncbi:uncharacterized protein LOC126797128 [Argentina anserina]|uniref:uncharacterized protein LOC126797128 n=1 Tax=Argentina anserina TaxID=57926 RepID=UPI0021763ACA|nr:uncharacterized protein LOC126797128 [Potentilla anserina]
MALNKTLADVKASLKERTNQEQRFGFTKSSIDKSTENTVLPQPSHLLQNPLSTMHDIMELNMHHDLHDRMKLNLGAQFPKGFGGANVGIYYPQGSMTNYKQVQLPTYPNRILQHSRSLPPALLLSLTPAVSNSHSRSLDLVPSLDLKVSISFQVSVSALCSLLIGAKSLKTQTLVPSLDLVQELKVKPCPVVFAPAVQKLAYLSTAIFQRGAIILTSLMSTTLEVMTAMICWLLMVQLKGRRK